MSFSQGFNCKFIAHSLLKLYAIMLTLVAFAMVVFEPSVKLVQNSQAEMVLSRYYNVAARKGANSRAFTPNDFYKLCIDLLPQSQVTIPKGQISRFLSLPQRYEDPSIGFSALTELKQMTESDALQIFTCLDSNSDGLLSLKELLRNSSNSDYLDLFVYANNWRQNVLQETDEKWTLKCYNVTALQS
jgi:hypothetical protein